MDDMWYGTWENGDKKVPVHIRRLSPQLHSKSNVLHARDQHHAKIAPHKCGPIVWHFDSKGSDVCHHRVPEERKLAQRGRRKVYPFQEKNVLAAQVACGMDYLNSQLCVYRYICARNVFLSEGNMPKIANFRYAKILLGESSILKLPVEQIHIRWSPPEVLESGLFSLKSDVWSLGVLLTEIITNGKLPYSGTTSREELKRKIVKEHHVIPASQLIDCPPSLYEVLCSCWKYESEHRPQIEFIVLGLLDSIPFDGGDQATQTLH